MSAPFRLDGWTFSSSAFDVLGDVAGYNAHEARGRWARAGSEATERQSTVFGEAAIRGMFGVRGVEALLAAELAERVDGGIQLLRMDGIEWYASMSSTRQRAGRARAAGAKRDERGRLLPSKTSGEPAHAGVLDQHKTTDQPPKPSVPDPVPDQIIPDSPAARAIPQDAVKAMIDRARDRLNAMRAELAEANSWTGVHQLHFMDPGFRELRARILECGPDAEQRVNHVLDVALAEARAKNTVEYLTGSMFELRSWRKKLGMRVEDAARPRAGPRGNAATYGSSKPRTDHPEQPGIRSGGEVF